MIWLMLLVGSLKADRSCYATMSDYFSAHKSLVEATGKARPDTDQRPIWQSGTLVFVPEARKGIPFYTAECKAVRDGQAIIGFRVMLGKKPIKDDFYEALFPHSKAKD